MSNEKVLLVSHDTRGLGSFRRQCKIAAAFHRLSPAIELFLATSCELSPPPFVHVLPVPLFAETPARAQLLLRYVREYRPQAILVDKHPFGVRMDFKPALSWAHKHGIPCFYGLRDILDHPERVKAEWLKAVPAITQHFHKVLVYGERALFDVEQYGLHPFHIVYCGYISGHEGGQAGSEGVLCTVGAGDCNLANDVLRIFSAATFRERKTLISGPRNTLSQSWHSRQEAIRFCPEMHALWSSHRAVVCLGGYNTLIEALAYGLHIICVPRIEPRLEQLVRAKLFAARGWLHLIHPEDLSVVMVEEKAVLPLHPCGRPALGGADVAALTIIHEAGLHSKVVS